MRAHIHLEMQKQFSIKKEILVSEMDSKKENIRRYFRGIRIFKKEIYNIFLKNIE